MNIVRNDDLDMERIVDKWKPILDNVLNNENVDWNVHIEEISRYCEYHSNLDNSQGFVNDGNSSLLPTSLKIISKLNLEGKRFLSTNTPRVEFLDITIDGVKNSTKEIGADEVSITIDRNDILNSLEIIKSSEDVLVDMMVNKINSQLKYYDTLLFYIGVQSISLFSESTFTPRMLLRSRYSMIDRNQSEEPFYKVEKVNGIVTSGNLVDIDLDQYTKTVSEDGKVFWIDNSDDSEYKILSDIFSEREVLDMIHEYQNIIDGSEQSLNILTNLL